MKRLSLLSAFAATAVLFAVFPQPASAAGGGNVEFSVSGTLPQFPCLDCNVTFAGTGTGAGHAQALRDGVHYDATFTVLDGTVAGWANYTEPQLPLCPAYGSAAGVVTLTGGATGIVHSSATPDRTGTVSDVSFTLHFSYTRLGAVPVIVVTFGSITVEFFIPLVGRGSFTNTILGGAGSGVFEVDPLDAALGCLSASPLPFTVVGNALVASA